MAIDAKYKDNVVLKQDAFQNLLTNIKNYPIVDIDYINETDVDELHGDLVWKNYTKDTPCIKVTYGDDRTTKGNIIFADDLKQQVTEKNKIIKSIQAEINEATRLRNRWIELYKQNHAIYEDKVEQLEKLETTFNELETNKTSFLKIGCALLYTGSEGAGEYDEITYTDSLLDPSYFTYENILLPTYVPAGENPQTQTTINLEFTKLNSRIATLISNLRLTRNSTTIENNEIVPLFTDSEDLKVFDDFIQFIEDYNKLIFLDLMEIAGYSSQQIDQIRGGQIQINSTKVKEIIDELSPSAFTWTEFANSWNTNASQVYADFKDQIRNIVEKIKNNINVNLKYIRSMVIEHDNQIADLQVDIQAQQSEIDELNEQIKTAAQDQYDLVQPGEEYNSQRNYYTKNNNNEYTAYSYNEANWTDDVNNQIVYVRNDRTLFGYKYIKVGSNIKWDKNADGAIDVTGSNDPQATGTFRVDINSHIYEVPIKGLGGSGGETITLSGDVVIDGSLTTINDTSIGGDLEVTGTTTLHNVLGATDTIEVGTTANQANVIIHGGLTVDNTTTMNGALNTGGNLTVGSTTTNANAIIHGGLIVDQATTMSGALNVEGDTTLGGTLTVGSSTVPKDTGLHGNVIIDGTTTFYDDITVGVDTDLGRKVTTLNGNLTLNGTASFGGHIIPSSSNQYDFGSQNNKWSNIYATTFHGAFNGTATQAIHAASCTWAASALSASRAVHAASATYIETAQNAITAGRAVHAASCTWAENAAGSATISPASSASNFWRGDNSWSSTLEGPLTLAANHSTKLVLGSWGGGYGTTGSVDIWYCNSTSLANYKSSTVYIGTTYDNLKNLIANQVYGAVYNDYAEYRKTIDLEAGKVVIDNDDGTLSCASQRLQPGAQVISDTFGFSIGETTNNKTPLAVSGRVLVYTYQPRENYHAGMAVCSAPNGTVDIMTREEIQKYPDCIIGIVSEIPQYDRWGTNNIKVDGRIWIKLK